MMKLVEIDIGQPPRDPRGFNDNNGWLCSAVILPPYGEYLSHNSVSYWYNLDQYNIGGRIAKNSPEGEQLTRLIKDKACVEYVEKSLVIAVLKRLRPGQFVKILEWVRKEAAKEGRNTVRRNLAAILDEEY